MTLPSKFISSSSVCAVPHRSSAQLHCEPLSSIRALHIDRAKFSNTDSVQSPGHIVAVAFSCKCTIDYHTRLSSALLQVNGTSTLVSDHTDFLVPMIMLRRRKSIQDWTPEEKLREFATSTADGTLDLIKSSRATPNIHMHV